MCRLELCSSQPVGRISSLLMSHTQHCQDDTSLCNLSCDPVLAQGVCRWVADVLDVRGQQLVSCGEPSMSDEFAAQQSQHSPSNFVEQAIHKISHISSTPERKV